MSPQARARDRSDEHQLDAIPSELARLMRPMLPVLAREILAEVQNSVPDYASHAGPTYVTSTRTAVTLAVSYFVDHVADPTASRAELDETLRRIGRGEAYEGRSLDSLRAAFRIGATLAWRRLHAMAMRQQLSSTVLGGIGDELFRYMNSLSEQADIGYRQALAQLSEAAHEWRARVLDLVLAGPAAPAGELERHASAGNWPVPETVVVVAVRKHPGVPLPSVRMLHPQVLARLSADDPILLIPAPLPASTRAELEMLFVEHGIAIGCPAPLAQAEASLRWAQRALRLADQGVIVDGPVIDCSDHICTLWVHAEPLLADLVHSTLLAPLWDEAPNSRRILGETLLAWIETARPSAPALAALLRKHPQTIRYRLKRLRELFGDSLDDPRRLQEMHLALQVAPSL